MTDLKNKAGHMEDLIHAYLSGTITQSEKDELFQWLTFDPGNITCFTQLSDIWLSTSVFQDTQSFNSAEAFNRVKAKIDDVKKLTNESKIKEKKLTWLKAAVILIPIILISSLATKFLFTGHDAYIDTPFLVDVPYGSRANITLPDGSRVVMNAGSRLTCKEGFGKTHRVLTLSGEGYFNVAKNKALPFIVHAGNLDVRALGTEFNVKAYPEDQIIETILIHGSIQVNKKTAQGKAEKAMVLMPKQTLVYNKISDNIHIHITIKKNEPQVENPLLQPRPSPKVEITETTIDPVIYTTWKEVSWNVYHKTLSELAVELERKYNVSIRFESEALKAIPFSGTLKDESLEQVLVAIRIASPIEFKVNGKEVVFSENKALMEQYKQYFEESKTKN